MARFRNVNTGEVRETPDPLRFLENRDPREWVQEDTEDFAGQ